MSEVPAPYGVGASPAQTLPIPVILAHPAYQEFKRDLLTFILEDGVFGEIGMITYSRETGKTTSLIWLCGKEWKNVWKC